MMAEAQSHSPVRGARTPFYFNSAEHLLRIEPQRAATLAELLEAIQSCRAESIFQHTFRTLQEHHFIQEGYSNDFAHWAFFACNENGLAERLSSVDVREFTSIETLRHCFAEIIDDYLASSPVVRDRRALEPFYFCASDTVVVPTTFVARNMKEFAEALERISVHSVHYHFIEARLRLSLRSNDFSVWLEQMGLKRTAQLLNQIDIYTSTLQGVRNRIVRIVETALA
ncbi:MAG: hypothetical protein DMG68_10695 [Acidobacteria bacterium]|nr:MAG: hypothetical protein DMG68_10695 [Acidobacteriota bacterium]